MRSRSAAWLLLAVVATVIALGALPAAAQYPPTAGALTVDRTSVASGGQVHVSASGYKPFSTVQIFIGGQLVVSVQADAQGNIDSTVTVPAGLAAGAQMIEAKGTDAADSPRTVTATVTVEAAGTPAPGGGGLSTGAIAGIVAGAVVLLLIIIALARPRSRADV